MQKLENSSKALGEVGEGRKERGEPVFACEVSTVSHQCATWALTWPMKQHCKNQASPPRFTLENKVQNLRTKPKSYDSTTESLDDATAWIIHLKVDFKG